MKSWKTSSGIYESTAQYVKSSSSSDAKHLVPCCSTARSLKATASIEKKSKAHHQYFTYCIEKGVFFGASGGIYLSSISLVLWFHYISTSLSLWLPAKWVWHRDLIQEGTTREYGDQLRFLSRAKSQVTEDLSALHFYILTLLVQNPQNRSLHAAKHVSQILQFI